MVAAQWKLSVELLDVRPLDCCPGLPPQGSVVGWATVEKDLVCGTVMMPHAAESDCSETVFRRIGETKANNKLENKTHPLMETFRNREGRRLTFSKPNRFSAKGFLGLGRHRTHVNKLNADRHPGCETNVERADLGVNVRKECRPGPPANLHDGGALLTLEFQSHCPRGPKRVGVDPIEVVAMGNKICVSCSKFNKV